MHISIRVGARRFPIRLFSFLLFAVGLVLGPSLLAPSVSAEEPKEEENAESATPKKRDLGRFVRKLTDALSELVDGDDSAEEVSERPIVAHIHLSGILNETPVENPFGLSGGQASSLREVLNTLERAREDTNVKGIILTFDKLMLGTGQMEELHRALLQFREVKKPVFIHAAAMDLSTYTLVSAGSYISVAPMSSIWLTGMHSRSMYIKRLLEKIGVEADFLHMGDYKAAAEMFTRTEPSREAKENMDWLLDGLYGALVSMIAEARDLKPRAVRTRIDNGPYIARSALDAGLIDAVEFRDEFVKSVRKKLAEPVTIDNRYDATAKPSFDLTNIFSILSLFSTGSPDSAGDSADQIALIFVEGMILPGYYRPSAFGDIKNAYSGDIRKALERAAASAAIKAVVIRVNSPGGSAEASEVIWNAVRRVKTKKTVVVSMGNVAASGGYYVACGADTIFADAATITGSIGVVGGKFVTTGLWGNLGIDFTDYKRGANADMLSSARRWNDDQRRRMTQYMEAFYGTFTEHVEAGRGAKLKKGIDELAGGRVFTGEQARELGLIDKLGGLSDAIAHAAEAAKVVDYDVVIIPRRLDFFTGLITAMQGGGERPSDIRLGTLAFGGALDAAKPLLPLLQTIQALDPETARALRGALARMALINREGVVLLMPFEPIFR